MGQVRTAKTGDLNAFPGTAFVIDDTPPAAQCTEVQITLAAPTFVPAGNAITSAVPRMTDISVIGKKATIAGSPSDDGTYDITAETDSTITIDHTFVGNDGGCAVTCHDSGQAYLTRNMQSFAKYIHNQGAAYTIKGGQLYTNIADPPIDAACTTVWNPQ